MDFHKNNGNKKLYNGEFDNYNFDDNLSNQNPPIYYVCYVLNILRADSTNRE